MGDALVSRREAPSDGPVVSQAWKANLPRCWWWTASAHRRVRHYGPGGLGHRGQRRLRWPRGRGGPGPHAPRPLGIRRGGGIRAHNAVPDSEAKERKAVGGYRTVRAAILPLWSRH